MSGPKAPKRPANPRIRANIYSVAALYVAYLLYLIAKPYLTHDPYGPTKSEFIFGVVVLGGGTVFLALMAWKMFKTPMPEEPEEAGEEALPEDTEEDGGNG